MSTNSKDGKEIMKSKVAFHYKTDMEDVDLKDLMFQPYLLVRKKRNKWYIKVFKTLLNAAIHNTMVLLKAKTCKQKLKYLSFRMVLIKCLNESHGPEVPRPVYGHPFY